MLRLDFDGVLHPESVYFRRETGPFLFNCPGHTLFEHAALLDELLQPYPDLRIVLSTAWVQVYRNMSKVARRLPDGLRSRVVGATYHKAMDAALFNEASRCMQVWSDVLRRKQEAWIALDDDYLHWPAWCRDRLVLTDEIQGLSTPAVLAEFKERLFRLGASARY